MRTLSYKYYKSHAASCRITTLAVGMTHITFYVERLDPQQGTPTYFMFRITEANAIKFNLLIK